MRLSLALLVVLLSGCTIIQPKDYPLEYCKKSKHLQSCVDALEQSKKVDLLKKGMDQTAVIEIMRGVPDRIERIDPAVFFWYNTNFEEGSYIKVDFWRGKVTSITQMFLWARVK